MFIYDLEADMHHLNNENFQIPLQPINIILTHFLDNNPASEAKKKEDNSKWNQIQEQLTSSIHQAASSLKAKGKMTAERLHHYVMSGKTIFVMNDLLFTYMTELLHLKLR